MARILIADDDAGVRELLARLCAFRGHECIVAEDSAQAIKLFDNESPELVLLDLALPPEGGQAVAAHMRGSDAARCPLVVITGYADALTLPERSALRAHAILRKPLEMEELFAAITSAIGDGPAGADRGTRIR
jgi:DNA-binding NtrC family response regulator